MPVARLFRLWAVVVVLSTALDYVSGCAVPVHAQEGDDVVVVELPEHEGPLLMDFDSAPDVLIVYTPGAAVEAGSDVLAIEKIQAADAWRRDAYARSAMVVTGGRTIIRRIERVESGAMGAELTWLRNDPEVAALRDEVGADLVAEISGASGGCGIAYLLTSLNPAFESAAFSVTDMACLPSTYAHELGHNQGCHHNPENASGGQGITNYAYGHRHCESGGYRTIMSYQCPTVSLSRVPNYSNPLVSVLGLPTGTSAPDCSVYGTCRDCARAIDYTAPLVAAFRLRPLVTTTTTMLTTTTTETTTTTTIPCRRRNRPCWGSATCCSGVCTARIHGTGRCQ